MNTFIFCLQMFVKMYSASSGNEAQMMENQENHDGGARIVRELLKKKNIHHNTFVALVKRESDKQLLRANIFSYNLADNTITFRSRAIEVFVKEHPDIFDSEKEENKRKFRRQIKRETRRKAPRRRLNPNGWW